MRTHLLYLSMMIFSCGGPMPGGADVPGGKDGQQGTQGAAGRDGRDAVVAGSRLRPLYYTGSDGTRFFGVFYDTERREKCSMALLEKASWPDGPWFCAPLQPLGYVPLSEASKYVRFSLE